MNKKQKSLIILQAALGITGFLLYTNEVITNHKLKIENQEFADRLCLDKFNENYKKDGYPEINMEEFKEMTK